LARADTRRVDRDPRGDPDKGAEFSPSGRPRAEDRRRRPDWPIRRIARHCRELRGRPPPTL